MKNTSKSLMARSRAAAKKAAPKRKKKAAENKRNAIKAAGKGKNVFAYGNSLFGIAYNK